MAATQEGDKFVSPIGMEFSQVCVLLHWVILHLGNRTRSSSLSEWICHAHWVRGWWLYWSILTGKNVCWGPGINPFFSQSNVQDNAPAAQQSRPFRELSYVRVHGHVRNFQGQKHIIAFRVSVLCWVRCFGHHANVLCTLIYPTNDGKLSKGKQSGVVFSGLKSVVG